MFDCWDGDCRAPPHLALAGDSKVGIGPGRLGDPGCETDFDLWDCADANAVGLSCNGLWCGQAPSAVRVMAGAGDPADRIRHCRGGMQGWRLPGLTVIEP